MNFKPFAPCVLALTVLAFAGGAWAQPSTPHSIGVGATVNGELLASEKDPMFEDWVLDRYDLRLTKGQVVTITLKSKDFDPYIDFDLGDEHVDADDDGGEVFDSKLVVAAEAAGVYRINVTSSSENHDETGAYVLQVVAGGTPKPVAKEEPAKTRPAPPAPSPIRLGQTVRGQLSDTSPLEDDDTPYEAYVFSGKKGQSVAIDLQSKAFDTYVKLMRKGYDASVKTDDDGGEDSNSKMTALLPADGDYEIRANSVEDDARGAFTLALAEGPARVMAKAVPIAYGQLLRGELGDGDAQTDDNSYFDLYRFKGKAKDKISIVLTSGDFDAFLTLSLANGGRQLETNDDADGSDAQIDFVLPMDGEYDIQANTLIRDEKGKYVLGVSLAPR